MAKLNKIDGTIIIGAILLSTIEQVKFLGSIGEEVLKKFNLKEVDKEKFYPRAIRGNIHQNVLNNYGEKALYYLGVEQFNNIANQEVFKKNLQKEKYNLENFKIINKTDKKKNIKQQQIIIRERLIKIISKLYSTPGAIIAKNDKIVTSYRFKEENILIFSITNAVYEKHHEFNRGSLLNFFIKHIGDYWFIEANYIHNLSEFRKGLSKNVFEFKFKYKKNKDDLFINHLKFTSNAKDDFLKAVLNESQKQKNIALEQSKRMRNISKKIGKYIPPQIHDGLFKGVYDTEIKTKRKKLTIFFSDIKNFTDTSEKLQPEDLTKYLNEYFSEMTDIALNHGATIDKYIGDAVMLFFGDPNSKGEKEDARACVEMSLKMQEKMIELREKWKNEGFFSPFEIRIGINTGYCNVGNFGSSQRLTYTIIGGEVNVAARLEAAGNAGSILMSYETYAYVQDMIEVEEKPAVTMKGINREIKVFEVIGRKSANIKKVKNFDKSIKLTNKKIEDLNKKIEVIDKQFNVLKTLINDLNKQRLE